METTHITVVAISKKSPGWRGVHTKLEMKAACGATIRQSIMDFSFITAHKMIVKMDGTRTNMGVILCRTLRNICGKNMQLCLI